MRTIHSLLEYHITETERPHLYSSRIINGIGVEGQNLEEFLLESIMLMTGYDRKKASALVADLKLISEEHDIDYRFQLGFYSANYKFAKKLYHLLHWGKWYQRLALALLAFNILNRYGKIAYITSHS